MPGVRVSADSTAAEVQVEPRTALRWRVGEQTMLKIGGGRYTQRPEAEHLFFEDGQYPLPTTRSWQVSVGWEQTVAQRVEVGVEGYRKWLVAPLLLPLDAPPTPLASGDTTGIEFLTRYRLRERFFLWGWVAVQRATLRRSDGSVFPAAGDQLLSGGMVASLNLGNLNLGVRYRVASGLPYTPLEGSLYDAGQDTWRPIPADTHAARFPPYHKLDLRISHRWDFPGWSFDLTGEVWYVPPAAAQLYPTWNYNYTEQGWVVGPTVLPLLSTRATF
jgi:hypothetical protein